MNEIISFIKLPMEIEGYGQVNSSFGMRVFQKHYLQIVDMTARLRRSAEILDADREWNVLELSRKVAEEVYEEMEGFGDIIASNAYSAALQASERILKEELE